MKTYRYFLPAVLLLLAAAACNLPFAAQPGAQATAVWSTVAAGAAQTMIAQAGVTATGEASATPISLPTGDPNAT
ncbi:MAG: hypothetical protein ACKOC5_13725, partial [Chloroflexota bacterium]